MILDMKKMIRKTIIFSLITISLISVSWTGLSINDNRSSINLLDEDQINIPIYFDELKIINELKLLYPLTSVPVIIDKGGIFKINFLSEDFDNLDIHISTAYEPIIDIYSLEIMEITNNNNIWNVVAKIPIEVTEELYNISIFVEKNGKIYTDHEPRAVSVVSEFKENFSFIHITDLHLGDPRGFTESIRKTLGWKSLKKSIDEINLIHPDFVIITGDLVYGQLYPFEYKREYKKCYEVLQRFDVPTYLCPGNHDGYRRIGEDGLKFWNEYFGPFYYSFNYGNHHFIACNSYDMPDLLRISISFFALNWGGNIGDGQLQWIENDLQTRNYENLYLFMHHNPLWETKKYSFIRKKYQNRIELLSLIDEYNANMVLAGHIHADNVTIINDTIFVTTTTPAGIVREKDAYWGYRLIEIENGEIVSYNYNEPKFSIPSYHLSLKKREGLLFASATITNGLEIDLNLLVKFVMPLKEYSIDNGDIILKRDGTDKTELYVRFIANKQSKTKIKLSPKSLAENK
ncbi:MAG: hypothetical protein GF329_00595 [Candidatus Lokiarchaeota archaeon]|nr:hypothetical protein [Candidatus Lokiarchaeota archaeon]